MRHAWLREASWRLASSLMDLYLADPLTHCYLLYDMVYERARSRVLVGLVDDSPACYILYWRHPDGYSALHLWGECSRSLLASQGSRLIGGEEFIMLHLYAGDGSWEARLLESMGFTVDRKWFLDMVVDEDSLKPRMNIAPVRLGPGSIDDYISLLRGWGRRISRESAESLITRNRLYGVYINSELVAVAGTYIRLPEVWVIGGVYVHPAHRGKGLGSAVTSAVTMDAVRSGAKALLHVEEGNTPARRLYESLGYRVTRRRPWLFAQRRSPLIRGGGGSQH